MSAYMTVNPKLQPYVAQIYTHLYVSGDQPPAKRLAVTAAERGEGKTSLGLALACQLTSYLGAAVAFIEANLRAPAAARLAGEGPDHPGFGDLLAGHAELEQATIALGDQLPDLVPAGTVRDPSQTVTAMNKDILHQTLDRLGQTYQYLILETPPINLYPEAQVLVALADQVLLVVRAGATSREAAAQAVKRIELAGGKTPSVVLNRKKLHLPEFLYKRL